MKKTYRFRSNTENATIVLEVTSTKKDETSLIDIHTYNTRGELLCHETFGIGDLMVREGPFNRGIWSVDRISRITSSNVYYRDCPNLKEIPVPIVGFAELNYRGFRRDRVNEHNDRLREPPTPEPPGYWDGPYVNFGSDGW